MQKEDKFIYFVKKHESAVRFLFIGIVNTTIDISIYAILANLFNVYPVAASLISTGITLIFSFIMNHYFVFQSNKKKRQTAIRFLLITVFNVWFVQSSVIFISLNILYMIPYFESHNWTANMLAKLIGIIFSMSLNYLGYKRLFN